MTGILIAVAVVAGVGIVIGILLGVAGAEGAQMMQKI